MLKKLKSKFKSFVRSYLHENELIKECNRKIPIHRKISIITSLILCLVMCLVLLFTIPSSAADSPDFPTDLTGYTVNVPSGWSVTAGYGLYELQGSFRIPSSYGSHTFVDDDGSFALGYDSDGLWYPEVNYCAGYTVFYDEFGIPQVGSAVGCSPSDSFIINCTGGTGSSDSSLIQWFVDNNATFELTTPATADISSGYYNLSVLPSAGVPSIGGFYPWLERLYEVPVTLVDTNGELSSYSYFGFVVTDFQDSDNFSIDFTVQLLDIGNSIRVANLTAVDGVCSSQFFNNISRIYFHTSFSVPEDTWQLFSFTFVLDPSAGPDLPGPDEPDVPDSPEQPDDSLSNPWAYILEMIIEALKVPLFGYFSIWDIYVTIISIFILTWLLKLIAGG